MEKVSETKKTIKKRIHIIWRVCGSCHLHTATTHSALTMHIFDFPVLFALRKSSVISHGIRMKMCFNEKYKWKITHSIKNPYITMNILKFILLSHVCCYHLSVADRAHPDYQQNACQIESENVFRWNQIQKAF